jgi:hypothetical protein
MKKLISIIIFVIVGLVVATPNVKAQPVIIYSNQCCDVNNYVRCLMYQSAPVLTQCYCEGQGYGHVC